MPQLYFSFTVDTEAVTFAGEVVSVLQNRYVVSRDRAVRLIENFWRDQAIGGPDEIVYHDVPDVWAARIYFAPQEPPQPPLEIAPFRIHDLVRVRELRSIPRHVGCGVPSVGETAIICDFAVTPARTLVVAQALDDAGQIRWTSDFLPEELEHHALAELIARYAGGFVADPHGLRGWVEQHRALPVMLDMGGCFAMRECGDVVSFTWDDVHDVQVEYDRRLRNSVLFQAVKRFPQLRSLEPIRGADAIACEHCAGAGHVRGVAPELGDIVCYCGGLGWIPAPNT